MSGHPNLNRIFTVFGLKFDLALLLFALKLALGLGLHLILANPRLGLDNDRLNDNHF